MLAVLFRWSFLRFRADVTCRPFLLAIRLAQTALAQGDTFRKIVFRYQADWNCIRVLLGMDKADRDRVSDFVRIDNSCLGTLVVTLALF